MAGGGSGGHVFPALAVGEELVRRGHQVSFTGSESGMEARLVRERGLSFEPLPARPLVGRGVLDKVRALVTVGRSTLAARSLVRRRGISVVVGTGGYASAPAVLGARLAGVPSLLVEPNAQSGLANRWLSRWAAAAAVAYEATTDELQCPAVVTGIPVRPSFFELPPVTREDVAAAPRLLVLGGSQGARQLNETVPRALALLELAAGDAAARISVVHQAGRHLLEETRSAYEQAGLSKIRAEVVPFIDDMAAAMGRAHLVLSRAGAITMAEIAASGRATVLVPLPIAGGHQITNARLMADAGAGRVLDARNLPPETLSVVLQEMLLDPERLAAAGRASRSLARQGAVEAIADRVAELAEDAR